MENLMGIMTMFITAVALAADASIVSITCGIGCCDARTAKRTALKASVAFGVFQGGMTFIGWGLGYSFKNLIANIDHWVAFGILLVIGIKMIKEAFQQECKCISLDSIKVVLILSIATSIDALAVGISYSLINMSLFTIGIGSILIALVTSILSAVGVVVGVKFKTGFKNKEKLNIIGGVILILIGLKILIEHLIG